MSAKTTVCAAVFAACAAVQCGLFAQVKPNDFSRGNSLAEKTVEKKQSDLVDKRSQMGGKEFGRKEYKNTKDASALLEKSFYADDKHSPFSVEARFGEGKKSTLAKDFEPKKKDNDFAERKSRFATDTDLSKKYSGKLDFGKDAAFSPEKILYSMEQMQECSMQDINRYQFRHSHPTTPGIKTTAAGGNREISESGSGFLDAFSSRKRIDMDTPAPSMMGRKDLANRRTEKNKNSELPNAPHSSRKARPLPQHAPQQPREEPKGKVKKLEYIDESKSGQFDFLRVPKGMKPKGRAVIKIETDE